jgi:antitoxin (DNA-binding transcriptional repressor) of toxin-antitoxin stability system
MKQIDVQQLPAALQQMLEDIQHHRILIVRNGEPIAVIGPLGNKDEEDLDLEESPGFWQMIQERRREQATVSLEQVMAEIAAEEQRLKESSAAEAKQPEEATPYARTKSLFDLEEAERILATQRDQGRPLADILQRLDTERNANSPHQ